MKAGRRIVSAALIIIFTILTLTAEPVWAATSSELQKKQDKLNQQKNQTQQELDNANSKADALEREQNQVGEKIEETNGELVAILADIELIKGEISQKEADITDTQAKYDEAQRQAEELYAAMCSRIKFMYEKGNVTYVEIMLKAASFSDMTTKAGYAESLYEYDRNQLDAYATAQQEAADYKAQLEEEKSELETTQEELGEEQGYLETMLSKYRSEYSDYGTRLASARSAAGEYAAKLKKQTQEIASLDTEIARAKAHEEAERKAAEEARKKAAEAAKKAAASNTAGGDGQSASSSSSSSGSSNKSYSPPGSATGSNIASYACQFVGNPYVFGGTSLTNGCDCSGFVYSVYGAFGISVPRSSYSLATAGTAVSYEDARPGDVIVYPGHCAIYLGDGRIVHASSAKTGIKYGYALYRTITAVRRFV